MICCCFFARPRCRQGTDLLEQRGNWLILAVIARSLKAVLGSTGGGGRVREEPGFWTQMSLSRSSDLPCFLEIRNGCGRCGHSHGHFWSQG